MKHNIQTFFKDSGGRHQRICLSHFKLNKMKYVRMCINDQCWLDREKSS